MHHLAPMQREQGVCGVIAYLMKMPIHKSSKSVEVHHTWDGDAGEGGLALQNVLLPGGQVHAVQVIVIVQLRRGQGVILTWK